MGLEHIAISGYGLVLNIQEYCNTYNFFCNQRRIQSDNYLRLNLNTLKTQYNEEYYSDIYIDTDTGSRSLNDDRDNDNTNIIKIGFIDFVNNIRNTDDFIFFLEKTESSVSNLTTSFDKIIIPSQEDKDEFTNFIKYISKITNENPLLTKTPDLYMVYYNL